MNYAQKINNLYEVSTSNFVTLQERLEKTIAKAPQFKAQLEAHLIILVCSNYTLLMIAQEMLEDLNFI